MTGKLNISDKNYYKEILKLAGPVALTQAGQILVQLIDNAMVGQLGTLPLAATSFASSISIIFLMLVMGMSLGLTPLVGEMYSSGNHRISANYLQNSLLLYGGLGVAVFGMMMAFIPIMSYMGQPADVVEMAIPYYKYISWSVFAFMLFAPFKQFLEGLGNTKVAMTIIITANAINVLFNWLLIYGHWGFPEMGVAGAGLATLISRLVTPFLIIAYFWKRDSLRRYFDLFSRANFSWIRIKSLIKVGWPIALQFFLEVTSFSLLGIMMGWIGTVEIAANQIAILVSNVAFLILISIGSSVTIRVSHAYGQRDFGKIKKYAGAGYRLGLMWNAVIAIVFLLTRRFMPLIFNSDPAVVELASALLLLVALFQIPDGLQAISISILRGIQDVKIISVIALISYVIIGVPMGYICAFVFGIGAYGLWIGITAGIVVAAIMGITRYRRQMKIRQLGI